MSKRNGKSFDAVIRVPQLYGIGIATLTNIFCKYDLEGLSRLPWVKMDTLWIFDIEKKYEISGSDLARVFEALAKLVEGKPYCFNFKSLPPTEIDNIKAACMLLDNQNRAKRKLKKLPGSSLKEWSKSYKKLH
jgi:hypothetical protein